MTVLDLNEPETTVSFFVPETPERFVFAPDGKRLFCITAKGGKFVVSKERAIRLPLPASALNGSIDWAENTRVFVGDKVLDLDTLQLSPAPGNRPSSRPASQPHIRLRPGERITSVQESRLVAEPKHFFADAKRDYSVLTPATAEIAFLSADATKLFLVRDRELTVFYFERRGPRETKLTVDMKTAPPASIANALKARTLIAVLCPPVINPLNDKPVAADLSRVKAVLGVESWEGQTATLFLKEDYGLKPEAGDAVGLLLDTGRGRTVSVDGFENWWSLVRDISAGASPETMTASLPESPKPEPTPKENLPPIPESQSKLADPKAASIRSFIRDHHAKSSRGDVDALIADYAERVDHLNGSFVAREVIREEEVKYHSPGTRVSEIVAGEIVLTPVSETVARAAYTIRFEQVRPSGAWARGFSDIELFVEHGASPPRIVRQRAKSREVQKGP
jgi:hypothetical protein